MAERFPISDCCWPPAGGTAPDGGGGDTDCPVAKGDGSRATVCTAHVGAVAAKPALGRAVWAAAGPDCLGAEAASRPVASPSAAGLTSELGAEDACDTMHATNHRKVAKCEQRVVLHNTASTGNQEKPCRPRCCKHFRHRLSSTAAHPPGHRLCHALQPCRWGAARPVGHQREPLRRGYQGGRLPLRRLARCRR